MKNNYLILGQWNVICDVCGVKFKSGQVKKRWDGFLVCDKDWEQRHPMDFFKMPDEVIAVKETRPQAQDVFTNTSYVTIYWDDGYVQDIQPSTFYVSN